MIPVFYGKTSYDTSGQKNIEENCHTNWDSMRAAWQNSFEEMYS